MGDPRVLTEVSPFFCPKGLTPVCIIARFRAKVNPPKVKKQATPFKNTYGSKPSKYSALLALLL